MKTKALTVITAAVLASVMLIAPLGSAQSSYGDDGFVDFDDIEIPMPDIDDDELTQMLNQMGIQIPDSATGTFGFLLEEGEVDALWGQLIQMLSASGSVPQGAGLADLIKMLFIKSMSPGQQAQVDVSRADIGAMAGMVVDIRESADSLTVAIDGVADVSFGMTASVNDTDGSGVSIDNASVDAAFAFGMDLSFGSVYDRLWRLSDVSLEAALTADVVLDITATAPGGTESRDFDASADLGLYITGETVRYGEPVLSIVMANNIGSFVRELAGKYGSAPETPAPGQGQQSALPMNLPPYYTTTEELDDIFDDDLTEEGISKQSVRALTALLSADVGKLISSSGELPPEAVAGVSELITVFLGDDGFVSGSAEAEAVRSAADRVMQENRVDFASIESTVTILKPAQGNHDDDEGLFEVVDTFTVKAGGSVPMSEAAIQGIVNNPPQGMRFVGWEMASEYYVLPDGKVYVEDDDDFINRIYGDCYLIPEFGKVYGGFDQIPAGDTATTYVITVVGDQVTISQMLGGKTYILEKTDVGSLADRVEWIVAGGTATSVNGTIVTDINTTVTVEGVSQTSSGLLNGLDLNGAFEVSFRDQEVPTGTQVKVYTGDRYAAGTIFQVYHIANGTATLSDSAVMVDESGAVTFDVPSCSSYVLVKSTTDGMPFDGSGSVPGSGGTNWLLYGGIAVGVIVLIGAAVFLLRRH